MTPEESLAKIAQLNLEATKEWMSLWKVIIPSIITFATVYLGYRFATNQARTKRKTKVIEKQLLEFYSPIWGCIQKINAQKKLRVEISNAAGTAWKNICIPSSTPCLDYNEKFKPYDQLITHENDQFINETLPIYDTVLEIFTSQFWLSEESTRQYYIEFYRFVEIWHRCLNRTIPSGVWSEIKHGEGKLKPFYKDIGYNMTKLRKRLEHL